MNIDDFKDIAPIEDSEFKARMAELVDEPAFEHAVRFVMPDVDYQAFTQQLRQISTKDELQQDKLGNDIQRCRKLPDK